VSYNKIGNVQKAQDDLAGALKSYQDGLAIIHRLAKSDPGNAGWQRDLWFSVGRIASAYRDSGDNAKALDFFRQGQAIISRLTKLSPDNAQLKKDLAWINQQIAELAARQDLIPSESKPEVPLRAERFAKRTQWKLATGVRRRRRRLEGRKRPNNPRRH
jgi:tetratricopeptide (TPR) repeat protein